MQRKKLRWNNLSLLNSSFLISTPIMAVLLSVHFFLKFDFQWWMFGLFFFMYIATGMGITAGYHRLFAHKTYETNLFIKTLLLLFGAGAFQNSALKWSTDHRTHHNRVDTPEDPYSIQEGFWYAHILWIFFKEDSQNKFPAPDLEKDALVTWQDKYYLLISGIMGFGFPIWIGYLFGSGYAGFLFGGLVRVVVVHHCTFFINSLCHFWGKQTYTDENSAKDSFLMALFTYGEGYHNFHHKFQGDYRNGLRWYHFDPTKWMIQVLASLKLAWKLKKVPDEEIFKAKLRMEQKRVVHKLGYSKVEPYMEDMRLRVEVAQRKFRHMKREYRRMKKEIPIHGREKIDHFKSEMEAAKQEFKTSYYHWKMYLNSQLELA